MVQLNKLTFEELKQEFKKLMRSIERIVPMTSIERIKRPGIKLEQEPSKKQKTIGSEEVLVIQENVKEPVIVKKEEIAKPVKKTGKRRKIMARKRRFSQATAKGDDEDSEYEKEKEQLSLYLTIAFDEDKEVDYEILDQKSPIIEWKSEYYGLKPMPDEVEVPEGDLTTMFHPIELDEVWRSQQNWNIMSWKLHNSSGVHTLQTDTDMIIYMLVEKTYPLLKKILMQMLKGFSVASKCALWFRNLEARNGDEKGCLSVGLSLHNKWSSFTKNRMVINSPCFYNKELATPEQMATALTSPVQTATVVMQKRRDADSRLEAKVSSAYNKITKQMIIKIKNAVKKRLDTILKSSIRRNLKLTNEDDMDKAAAANLSTQKSSASNESSKGKTPPKTSKSGKSATAEEPDEEHVHEVSMDAEENFASNMGNADEQTDGEAVLKTENALKNNWFKQPPRYPTPDPEWNKCQVVDDKPEQTWFNDLVSAQKDPLMFDELMATPIDFSKAPAKLELNSNTTWKNAIRLYLIDLIGQTQKVDKQFGYGYLEEIMVRRADRQLYTFKEGDFINLHLHDIEDMLLLVVQHKLFHLDGNVLVDLKKLNVTNPQKDFPTISVKETYTPSFDLLGVVYEDSRNCKRLMRADELYKFLNGTLKLVRDTLHHRLLNFRLGYNKDMPRTKWSGIDKRRPGIMVNLIDKQLLERRIMRNLKDWLLQGNLRWTT
ncbi:hypothetical protein Tco_0400886 [Tanacetum coccineum]